MQAEKEEGTDQWNILGLQALGPNPNMRDKLELFGQFVGDWDILECRYLNDDGTWTSERGRIHWRWILEGNAVQDVWSTIDEKNGRETPGGTTIRFYDPEIDAWRSTWISPLQNVVKVFIGRKVGNEIILEGKNEKGHPMKWIFFEIKPDSFRWRAEETQDEGKTWAIHEEMQIRRRL